MAQSKKVAPKIIYPELKPGMTVDEMLKHRTLPELLEAGYVLDIKRAAALSGYSAPHLSRLCHNKRIKHVARKPEGAEEWRFYFLPEHVRGIFETVEPV